MPVGILLIDVWVVESLADVLTGVLLALKFVVVVSYAVEVLSDVVTESSAANIGVVEVLANMNVNLSAAVMTTLEFPMPIPYEESSFSAPFGCRALTVFNCSRVMHARMPSYQVWRNLALTSFPQFPNQDPPRPQQLALPDLLIVPHSGHTDMLAVVVTVNDQM